LGARGHTDSFDPGGQDSVTVQVGASGNGGDIAFDPANITIDPGTTVTWEWTGNGGDHNVVSTDGPAEFKSELSGAAGHSYEFTFTDSHVGTTDYECQPHASLGMVGSVTVESTGDETPETHESGVPQDVWDAVTAQNDPSDELTFDDLVDAIQAHHTDTQVDGVDITRQHLTDLITWYQQ
jgi:halocyanin-like protein